MAEYLIKDTTLIAIADAIRAKTRGTEAIPPEVMPAEIANIVASGGSIDFDFTDENLKYFAYQLDSENRIIYLGTIFYDVLYESTGSYDVVIPDQIGGYDVVIACM